MWKSSRPELKFLALPMEYKPLNEILFVGKEAVLISDSLVREKNGYRFVSNSSRGALGCWEFPVAAEHSSGFEIPIMPYFMSYRLWSGQNHIGLWIKVSMRELLSRKLLKLLWRIINSNEGFAVDRWNFYHRMSVNHFNIGSMSRQRGKEPCFQGLKKGFTRPDAFSILCP